MSTKDKTMPEPDRWEISNPHDRCYFHWNDPAEVWIALLFLGSGNYGAHRERDGFSLPVLLLASDAETNKYAVDTFGKPVQELIEACDLGNIAKVFASFTYATRRTSMTDLGAACEHYAKEMALRNDDAKQANFDQTIDAIMNDPEIYP